MPECMAYVMATRNRAEGYQEDISKIFDDFLELMSTSAARVEVESQWCDSFCEVKLSLWKCSSCDHSLLTTFFTVREQCDIKHLARYLDGIQKTWKFYVTSDDLSD